LAVTGKKKLKYPDNLPDAPEAGQSDKMKEKATE